MTPTPPRRPIKAATTSYAEAPGGALYSAILRGTSFTPTRSVLGVVLAVVLFLLITPVITQAIVMIGWAAAGRPAPFANYFASAMRFEYPIGMLGANLGLASLILICILLMSVVHRVRPGWLISVEAAFRWRFSLVCLAVAVLVLGGLAAVTAVTNGLRLDLPPNAWVFFAIIVLTSPLQAAAEEVMFRGYLTQALGSLVALRWFGVVVSAFLFAIFHGSQNLPLFVNRFAFGLLAGVLVVKTGGLEAAIAAHIVNNVLAYGLAVSTGTVATTRGISQVSWADASSGIGAFVVFAVVAWLIAWRTPILTRVPFAESSRQPSWNIS